MIIRQNGWFDDQLTTHVGLLHDGQDTEFDISSRLLRTGRKPGVG